MSIVSFIESLEKDESSLEEAVSKLHEFEGITVEFNSGKNLLPFVKGPPWFRVYGIEELLDENDTSDDIYWHFSSAGSQQLTEFITNFSEVYRKGFTFFFIWAGNEIGAVVKNVSLQKLLELIKDNKLEEVAYKVDISSLES